MYKLVCENRGQMCVFMHVCSQVVKSVVSGFVYMPGNALNICSVAVFWCWQAVAALFQKEIKIFSFLSCRFTTSKVGTVVTGS